MFLEHGLLFMEIRKNGENMQRGWKPNGQPNYGKANFMADKKILRYIRMMIVVLCGILCHTEVRAGPPFVTDDPEPVAYHHWEIYIASQVLKNAYGIQGTVPHVEINFGILPETQLHVIAPFAFSSVTQGSSSAGLGDIELGVKFRFINEYPWFPQVGTFPHVLLPTGDTAKNTGTGRYQVFVPLWLQKSIGRFTAYGGGGIWVSPGHPSFNYWSFGATLQYEIAAPVTVGAEVFDNTAAPAIGQAETGINLGAIFNVNASHHILVSAGADVRGPNRLMMYAAYQLTL
jgi:hypothetical protein